MHRARAYKGSKLGPEKQARQNPKVGFGTGPAVRPYRNRSKRNIRGKCSICSDINRRQIKVFMLVIRLGGQDIILSRKWAVEIRVLINCKNRQLIWLEDYFKDKG
jgi:hypothetical protein